MCECISVLVNGTQFVDPVDEQAGGVFHVECIQPGLHGPADGIEHVLAAGAPYRDDGGSTVHTGSADDGTFETIATDPEALTTVDEEFGLGGNAHEEHRGGEDDAVRVEDFGQDGLEVVNDLAAPIGETAITFGAGGNLVLAEVDFFSFRSEGFGSQEGSLEERVTVTALSRARCYAEDFQS